MSKLGLNVSGIYQVRWSRQGDFGIIQIEFSVQDGKKNGVALVMSKAWCHMVKRIYQCNDRFVHNGESRDRSSRYGITAGLSPHYIIH